MWPIECGVACAKVLFVYFYDELTKHTKFTTNLNSLMYMMLNHVFSFL